MMKHLYVCKCMRLHISLYDNEVGSQMRGANNEFLKNNTFKMDSNKLFLSLGLK